MVKSNMSRIRRHDVTDEPVGSEGGQSPSALSTGQNGTATGVAASGPLTSGQRWSSNRKRDGVLRLLRGAAAAASPGPEGPGKGGGGERATDIRSALELEP